MPFVVRTLAVLGVIVAVVCGQAAVSWGGLTLDNGGPALTLDYGTQVLSLAAGKDGSVYIGGDRGVCGVNWDTMANWEVDLGRRADWVMVGPQGDLYVLSADSASTYAQWKIYRLDATDGSVLNQYDSGYCEPQPSVDGNGLYFKCSSLTNDDVQGRSLDLETRVWLTENSDFCGVANPVLAKDGGLYLPGSEKLFKGDASSGSFSEIFTSSRDIGYLATDPSGNVFSVELGNSESICTSDDGCIDLCGHSSSGAALWPCVSLPATFPSYVTGMVVSSLGDIIITEGNKIVSYDSGTGALNWTYSGPTISTGSFSPPKSFGHPVVDGDGRVYAVLDGGMYVVKDGVKLDVLTSSAGDFGRSLLIDSDGWIYCSVGVNVLRTRVTGAQGPSASSWSMRGGTATRSYSLSSGGSSRSIASIVSLLLNDSASSMDSKFALADITVDGSYADWDGVPEFSIAKEPSSTSGATIDYIKFAHSTDGRYLYVLLKATENINKDVVYRFFLDTDETCECDNEDGNFQFDFETYSTGYDNLTGHDWAVTCQEFLGTSPYARAVDLQEVLDVSGAYIEARLDARAMNLPDSTMIVYGRTQTWAPNYSRYARWIESGRCGY